jgi:hypothetical protein
VSVMNHHDANRIDRRRKKLKPLKPGRYGAIREALGSCPLCSRYNGSPLIDANVFERESVIYRRSARSVTMRCCSCGLQWTVTFAQLNKALRRTAPRTTGIGERGDVENLIAATDAAAAAEHRGRQEKTCD